MSVLRVKANPNEEFDEAVANGCVYGKVESERPVVFVYVELGREGTYHRSFKDDEKTDYKIFYNCKVYAALSEAKLAAGVCAVRPSDTIVIVYGNSAK